MSQLFNTNIKDIEELITPGEVKKLYPLSQACEQTVANSRQIIQNILDDKDPRLFMVVGPCSIHDTKAALEYAGRLSQLAQKVEDKICLVMRVYFEKPRTTVGWKGLINDPYLDDSFHIEEGLKKARELLINITEMGLPTATEALDPISPQYLSELISWSAIGARTTESQTHRELSSGLSMPVGFKNGTNGEIQVAVNAMKSSLMGHHFLGINQEGKICKFSTQGNNYVHVVLRGGSQGPNYQAGHLDECEKLLESHGLKKKIVVDCSHANSNKDYRNQPQVLDDVLDQIVKGRRSVCGFMIESHLNAGNQKLTKDISKLQYGVSITDQCVDWDTTEQMITKAHQSL